MMAIENAPVLENERQSTSEQENAIQRRRRVEVMSLEELVHERSGLRTDLKFVHAVGQALGITESRKSIERESEIRSQLALVESEIERRSRSGELPIESSPQVALKYGVVLRAVSTAPNSSSSPTSSLASD